MVKTVNISDEHYSPKKTRIRKTKPGKGLLVLEQRNDNHGPNCGRTKLKWTETEDNLLIEIAPTKNVNKRWKEISGYFTNKTADQCHSRWERIKPGIKIGRWTKDEDEMLKELYKQIGPKWACISKKLQNRTDKQIRERIKVMGYKEEKKEKLTKEDKIKIVKLYKEHGPNWVTIKKYFDNRFRKQVLSNTFYAICKQKEKQGLLIIKPLKEKVEKQAGESSMATAPHNEENIKEETKLNLTDSTEIIVENYQMCTEMEIVNECQINGDINISINKNIEESTVINHSNKISHSHVELENSNIINLNDLIFDNIQGLQDMVVQRQNFMSILDSYSQS